MHPLLVDKQFIQQSSWYTRFVNIHLWDKIYNTFKRNHVRISYSISLVKVNHLPTIPTRWPGTNVPATLASLNTRNCNFLLRIPFFQCSIDLSYSCQTWTKWHGPAIGYVNHKCFFKFSWHIWRVSRVFFVGHTYMYMYMIPSLKLTVRTGKWMVGRWVSIWEGLFSGAILVSGRVIT